MTGKNLGSGTVSGSGGGGTANLLGSNKMIDVPTKSQFAEFCDYVRDAHETFDTFGKMIRSDEALVYVRIGDREYQIPYLMVAEFLDMLSGCWSNHLTWALDRLGERADWPTAHKQPPMSTQYQAETQQYPSADARRLR